MTRLSCVILGITFLIAGTTPALAYIDPTTGTFLLQILAAAALGVVFYFRKTIAAAKRLLGLGQKQPPKSDNDEPPGPD